MRNDRIVFVIACVLLVGVVSCRGDRSELPPVHLNPNMDQQKRIDPQEPDPLFKDGRGMRRPVPGTIARGQLRIDDHLYKGMVNGTFATTLPSGIKLDRWLIKRGQERFGIYCVPCHDPLATGNGIVYRRKAGLPKPANLHDPRIASMGIGYYFHVITTGQNAAFKQLNMQPMRNVIPARDRWAIAVYVRMLQRSQALTPTNGGTN
ncbi:MAG: cytochrome c [Myxococcales bacterium]|nr:cytochrome c [Myxococcales bacterium]